MPSFRYVAYDNRGRRKKGLIEAQTVEGAISLLKKRGVYPLEIAGISKDSRTRGFLGKLSERLGGTVSRVQRADVFFQLATLVDSGIPVYEALGIVAEQSPNARLREALVRVRDKVAEGVRFSQALLEFEEIFTAPYIKMIGIAEKTGGLAEILFKIAMREEEKSTFSQRIAPVILYPAFVLVLGMAIVSFLLAYVVPKMERIFSSFHKKLPLITRILISLGDFIKHYALIVILVIVAGVLLFRFLYLKKVSFRLYVDGVLLRIPIYRRVIVAQFTSALAFQLSAGIQLVDAVLSSAEVTGNLVFSQFLNEAAEKIEAGAPIEMAFGEANIFDAMFIASLSTGRKSGKLAEFVQRVSAYYDKKLTSLIKTTVALVEPIAILILGVVVGFIVMSIMVPLFNINQLVK